MVLHALLFELPPFMVNIQGEPRRVITSFDMRAAEEHSDQKSEK
jgi:hypothetical protein